MCAGRKWKACEQDFGNGAVANGRTRAEQRAAPIPPARRSLRSGSRVLSEEGYELWAPAYDRDPNHLLALEERTLKPLLPDLTGQQVLDLGCGTGRWLELLLDLAARRAVGVDPFARDAQCGCNEGPLVRSLGGSGRHTLNR